MSVAATVAVSVGEFALDVEVDVNDGEVLAVLGPNGAGKTTLLRALAGLAPIDRGRIVLDGTVVDDPHDRTFVPPERRSIGVVFQDYLLFPHLSVLDNVAFGLRQRGIRRRDARDRAATVLSSLGLEPHQHTKPEKLSGGQAQRVALARALATEPALLLLDEPLAALDVQRRVEARHAIGSALAGAPGARILVTHDPVDALTLADRLLVLHDGRVAQTGPADEVAAHPRSEYVADLVGTNLYRGTGRGTEVRVDAGLTLTVATHCDGDVLAIIPPHAVVLHVEQPHGSARNVVEGRVVGLDRLGTRVRARIDGAMPIVAEVTPQAVAALGLEAGRHVWTAVKATEITVFPA